MIIKQLTIYPIKGLGGINVKTAQANERGLVNDRRFMIVDPEGNFMSQRGIQEMALFRPEIVGDIIQVHYKNERIELNINQEQGEAMDTIVWGNKVNAIQVGKEANEWFSDQLGKKCILVKMNKDSRRNKSLLKPPSNSQVSFADGYPYLVLGTASLDHLNSKLEKPLTIDRFRANIIVNTKVPHTEDEIDTCTISGLKFRMIKPCARCQVITIDQQNAVSSKEPLKTLATYRKKENKVYFGMNAVCMEEGIINIGDHLLVE